MGGMWATKDSRHLQKPARNVSFDKMTHQPHIVTLLLMSMSCCVSINIFLSDIRNKIAEAAESVVLPTFVVADAGRTEVTTNYKILNFNTFSYFDYILISRIS